ncbi:hypothetical protein CLOLEP_03783 [[Clostridium] leptum DSM 753]|uniref:Uncharacterized protein n=1 Tax=[Clostridium] leptum DSM 753 TaxID=428125 RepID=A7VYV5_9FIRM|nr:hypothetical protein CLOLEP_03783 [[Clostridium] leptum DSM 753]
MSGKESLTGQAGNNPAPFPACSRQKNQPAPRNISDSQFCLQKASLVLRCLN